MLKKRVGASNVRHRRSFGAGKILSPCVIAFALTSVNSGVVAAKPNPPPDAKEVVSCSVQMVPMRDGIKLATEVYQPGDGGKHPVVMQRSPYNGYRYSYFSSNPFAANFARACEEPALRAMAARGYVVINQDVRGTFRSEGKYMPVVNEGNDGYDAVEWAARQPWSTGKVGMMGGSYLGLVQWQAALKRPPHLVTIVPSIAPVSFDRGWPYHAPGVLHQFVAQSWTSGERLDMMYRKLTAAKVPAPQINEQLDAYRRQSNLALLAPSMEGLPLADSPMFVNDLTPWYADWLAHPRLDAYWEATNVSSKFQTLSLPVLSLGSFYDLFIAGTIDGFTGMQQRSATAQARKRARLIVAGGGHIAPKDGHIGNVSFGTDNMVPADAIGRWFDYWLKGEENGVLEEAPVKLYVMVPPDTGSLGSGFWVNSDTYPLAGTKTVRYFPSGTAANSVAGSGILSTEPSTGDTSDHFRFDPAHPVQTIGGNSCCGDLLPGGAFDQRPVEIRPDVLVYTGEVLTRAMPVIGDVSVTLKALSSVPATYFTAKLVDVHPDGMAQNVSDGIVAATGAGVAQTYTISLNATATVFKPGHRIRLEISSSNYPRFPVATDPHAEASSMVVAEQTIFRDGTSLNLPVAPDTIIPVAKPKS